MKYISPNQGHEKLVLPFADRVNYACWNEDESEIAIGGYASTIDLWKPSQIRPHLSLMTRKWERFNISKLLWSRDGTKLLGYDDLAGWHIWDTRTGEILCSQSRTTSKRVFDARWNTDQKRVLAAHHTSVCVWDSTTGKRLLRITTYESIAALWGKDESTIFVSGYAIPSVYDAQTGKRLFRLELEEGEYAVRIERNRDGTMILATNTGTFDLGPTYLWDAKTGRKILTLPKAGSTAIWSPDESRILLYSGKTTINEFHLSLFDLTTQSIIQTFDHTGVVFRAFFNKTGTRVIIYGQNVSIFDVESGKPLLTILSGAYVRHAQLNADETLLLTAGDDGAVRVWDVPKLLE